MGRIPSPLSLKGVVGTLLLVVICLPHLASASAEFSDQLFIKLPNNPKPFIFDLTEADEAMGFTSVGGDFFAPHGDYCTGPCSAVKTTFTFTMTEGDNTTSDTVTVTIRPMGARDFVSISLNSDVGGNDKSGAGVESARTTDLFTKFPHGFAVFAISDCGTNGKSSSSCMLPIPEPQGLTLLGASVLAAAGRLFKTLSPQRPPGN